MTSASTEPQRRPQAPATSRAARQRLLLVVVLACEFLALLARFTTGTLLDTPGAWSAFIASSKWIPRSFVPCVVAVLVLRRTSLEAQFAGLAGRLGSPRLRPTLIGAHVLAFSLLVVASAQVFEGAPDASGPAWFWPTCWVLGVILTVITALALFAPLPVWADLLRSGAFVLSASLALGLVSFGLGVWCQEVLGPALQGVTLTSAAALLKIFTTQGVVDTQTFDFGTQTFQVNIAPECSGFEGIGLMAVFTSAYLWIQRRGLKFPRALWIPVAGIALAWVLNVVRLVGLVCVGTWISPEFAIGGFHSLFGLICFSALALSLVWGVGRSTWFTRSAAAPASRQRVLPSAAFLLPFLSVVAVATILSGLGISDPNLQLLRLILPILLLVHYRRDYAALDWRSSWPALAAGAAACAGWLAIEGVAGLWYASPGTATGVPAALWTAGQILGFVVVAPVCEELAFRGYLQRRLSAAEFDRVGPSSMTTVAWLVSSLAFGLCHEEWLAASLVGLVFGWVYRRSGRIGDAVAAHALVNALLVVGGLVVAGPSG